MIYIFRAFIRNHTDWFWPFVIWLIGAVFLITVMCVWEGRTIFESVYYCIVTASSTGFGDITPLTVVGRVCTIIYILTAITAMAVFINAIIARGKVINKKKRLGMVQVKDAPYLIIIGYPSKSKVLGIVQAIRAYWEDCTIVCISEEAEKPNWMYETNVHFVRGRGSQVEILKLANVEQAENILVLAENPADLASDEQTFSTVTMCEQLNPGAYTVAEKVHTGDSLLDHSMCDKVVSVCRPNELASEIANAGIIDFIDSIVSPATPERNKNVYSGSKATTWFELVQEHAKNGDIPLGYSIDGRVFTFAPAATETIPANSLIKLLTRK